MKARLLNAPGRVVRERQAIEDRFEPSAREWFPFLLGKLQASRPVIEPARSERPGTGGRPFDKPRVVPAMFGPPTFRNVIEDGKHV